MKINQYTTTIVGYAFSYFGSSSFLAQNIARAKSGDDQIK